MSCVGCKYIMAGRGSIAQPVCEVRVVDEHCCLWAPVIPVWLPS